MLSEEHPRFFNRLAELHNCIAALCSCCTVQFTMKVSVLRFAFLFSCFKGLLANRTYFLMDEVRSLSELPLDELIQIKSTIEVPDDVVEEDEQAMEVSSRTFSLSLPVAQPLKRNSNKPMRRYGHYSEEKGKDTKISKIFQISITALSFLAFGGYLLTLIITAIRQTAGNNTNGNVILLSNLQALQNYNRPKRSLPIPDSSPNEVDIEKLYRGLILLSKSYAAYNQ